MSISHTDKHILSIVRNLTKVLINRRYYISKNNYLLRNVISKSDTYLYRYYITIMGQFFTCSQKHRTKKVNRKFYLKLGQSDPNSLTNSL